MIHIVPKLVSGYGRSVGIRTRGLLDPNQARYQTSPHPDNLAIIMKIAAYVNPHGVFFQKNENGIRLPAVG